jgi:hypothetical protein
MLRGQRGLALFGARSEDFFKLLRLKGRKTTSLSNRRKLFAKQPACTISSIVSATCEVSPRQWKALPVRGHRCQKLHTDFPVILLLSARRVPMFFAGMRLREQPCGRRVAT